MSIKQLILTHYIFHSLLNLNIYSDERGGAMLTTFKNYKGNVEALRGGSDAAALIMGSYNYCGMGYLDAWR